VEHLTKQDEWRTSLSASSSVITLSTGSTTLRQEKIMKNFKNKVVVITGGATGIGKAMADKPGISWAVFP
jgi:FlaA1/EpsC-like NDP-sugar epimerase